MSTQTKSVLADVRNSSSKNIWKLFLTEVIMNKISLLLSQKLLPTIAVIFFTGTTLATSAVAGMKLIKTNQPVYAQGIVEQIAPLQEEQQPINNTTTTPITGNNIPAANQNPVKASPPAPTGQQATVTQTASFPLAKQAGGTQIAGAQNNATNTGNNQPVNSNACIITLFGKQYDVAPLRNTHPGGNIFTCGTDMTTVYQGQHGNDVSRMQPYLVTTNNTTGTSGTGGTTNGGNVNTPPAVNPSPQPRFEDDDNEEHEEENRLREEEETRESEHEQENESESNED